MTYYDEFFSEIDNFSLYSISNLGRVINVETERELKPYYSGGFLRVTLMDDSSKKHSIYLHRLVAKTFFVDYSDGVRVEHINGIRSDCSVANLHITSVNCREGSKVWK